MENSDQGTDGADHFYEQFSGYTDEEVLEILRKHKDYQDRAVTAAVKIAIERTLIHSEQDLMSPEFQYTRTRKVTLFPEITSKYHRERLISSIYRYLYILSLLPVIYGVMKYAEGFQQHTIIGLFIGITWFTLIILFRRTRKQIFFVFLLIMLLLVSLSIGNWIFVSGRLLTMDLVMLAIGLGLSVYMLVYLRKLVRAQA